MRAGGAWGMSDKITGFLSYSEADEAAVQRLRRRLRSYVIPAPLRAGGPSRLGQFIPERQTARTEEEVKQQLVKVEWLIVCCSPASFESARVNGEIDTYIRVNAGARFLMVLLEGEPRDVLPPRLRAREPLTSDLRAEGDGSELGFLKLVAALRDYSLGALRDHQAAAERARDRGGSLLTAGLAVLAVAGAGVSVNTMRERDQSAAMARAAIDLGANLAAEADDPAHSEEQFEQLFAQGVRSPAFVRQRAQLLVRFAELYQRRGDAALSQERALGAIAAFESLPENERASLDFTRALSLASEAEAEAGREAEAIDYAARAIEAARATLHAGDGRLQRASLAAALGRLGALHLRAGRPAEALPYFAEAIPSLDAVRAQSPDDDAAATNLIAGLNWLGDAQATTGDWAGARNSFERTAALTRARLESAPGNAQTRADLGASLMKLGQAMNETGDAQAARAPLEESLAIARAQVAGDASNAALRRQLTARLILTAQVQASLGAASAETLAEAIAAARVQTQSEPASITAKEVLADLLAANAARLRRAGDFTGARTAWHDTAQALRELRASSAANAPEAAAALAAALESAGEASTRLNDSPGALSAYGEAVRMRRAALEAAPQDKAARASLAQTLHTLALERERADNAAGARAAFDEAARLRVALATEDESDTDIASLAVDSLRSLAEAQQAANNTAGARRSLETARDLLARLTQAHPDNTRYAAALRRTEAALRATPASGAD